MVAADGFLVTCEHAGKRIPSRYRGLFQGRRALLESHRGWDAGALELARALGKRLRCEVIAYPYTRLLIDCNRSEHHRSLYSEFTRDLPAADQEELLSDLYRPHRESIREAIRVLLRRHCRVIHVAAHSFTPVLNGIQRVTDVGFLYDPKRTGERVFCDRWISALRAAAPDLRVRRNYPYRGTADGTTTALRKEHSNRNYVGVEVELNQALLRGSPRTVMQALADSLGLDR